MNGIKKAALFLSGLEYSMVDRLLGRLDTESARAVRREMMSLQHNSISVQESNQIDREFLHKAGRKTRTQISVPEHQFAEIPVPPAVYTTPKRQPVRFDVEAFIPKSRPFDFLQDWTTEEIVQEIAEEHPQTLTIILAHLPRSRAAEVMKQLPRTMQGELSQRLSQFEPVDEQILHEIEDALLEKKRKGVSTDSTLPNKTTQTNVSAIQIQERNNHHLTFESLESFSNTELATLFHSVDLATAMLSLMGASQSLIERVTQRFSPTEQHQMRQWYKHLGAIDEEDIDLAKNTILKNAALFCSQKR